MGNNQWPPVEYINTKISRGYRVKVVEIPMRHAKI